MVLPVPRVSAVEASVFICLAASFCMFEVPVHAQGIDGATSRGINKAVAGVSQGINGGRQDAGADASHGNSATGLGVSQQRQHYNDARKGISSSLLTIPGRNSSANTRAVPGRRSRPRLGVPVSRGREFLAAHNKVRASVNEPPLKWDSALARYARRFASKRAVDCRMLHSYGPYGENIFWGEKDAWTPAQVVGSWVSENQYYDKTNNVCVAGQMCGHYTQVVWVDSTRIGCAMVTCLNGGMYSMCIYDPPGNYVDESPFVSFPGDHWQWCPRPSVIKLSPPGDRCVCLPAVSLEWYWKKRRESSGTRRNFTDNRIDSTDLHWLWILP